MTSPERSEDFLREQNLRTNRFERDAAFAHRWALKTGKPEEILFSQESLKDAIGILDEDDVLHVNGDNKRQLAAIAVGKYLRARGLDGVRVDAKPLDEYQDMIVVVVEPI